MKKLFTAETAAEMARRSQAVQRERKQQRLSFTATEPLVANGNANQTGIPADEVRGVCRHVLALMVRTTDDGRLANLERCFSGVWDALCTATGTARPGPRKAAELRTRGVASLLGLTLDAGTAQVQADTPTGSVCAQAPGHTTT